MNQKNKTILFIYMVFVGSGTFFFPLEAEPKDPPNSITFVEGGVIKTFYRNPNVVAEFVDQKQTQDTQQNLQGKKGIKTGWNVRPTGKELFPKSTKSATTTKVTEVYSTGVGMGPHIVLPGLLIVTFSIDQSQETLERIAKKYGVQIQNQFSPRLVSFQTDPGFVSLEKANGILSEPNVLEAYPDTAVEKSLK
ncbi:hypothetical protein [Leptospira harrisiae]|uniref:Uncharacterized protein n=1 Tax=Leptospira harrisiae TaxID=2023189 RepID=A0A2N0AJK3_9LEPT|nr:hypothetical protein [Leptospira harrisiae]PJZ84433.1 hypothetical protein CH364_10420 [Leptospira harrisiae]PKA07177.1 hypothetical protein CH366_12120 [Leptospira harrisiae]